MSSRQLKITCVPLFAGACALLYFGTAMLFLVPGNPGYESSLAGYLASLLTGRFLYGALPVVLGAALLMVVGLLWARANGSPGPRKAIKGAFASAGAVISVIWFGLLIVAGFRQP